VFILVTKPIYYWTLFTGRENEAQRFSDTTLNGKCCGFTVHGLVVIRRVVKMFPEFPRLKNCDNWFNVIEE